MVGAWAAWAAWALQFGGNINWKTPLCHRDSSIEYRKQTASILPALSLFLSTAPSRFLSDLDSPSIDITNKTSCRTRIRFHYLCDLKLALKLAHIILKWLSITLINWHSHNILKWIWFRLDEPNESMSSERTGYTLLLVVAPCNVVSCSESESGCALIYLRLLPAKSSGN